MQRYHGYSPILYSQMWYTMRVETFTWGRSRLARGSGGKGCASRFHLVSLNGGPNS